MTHEQLSWLLRIRQSSFYRISHIKTQSIPNRIDTVSQSHISRCCEAAHVTHDPEWEAELQLLVPASTAWCPGSASAWILQSVKQWLDWAVQSCPAPGAVQNVCVHRLMWSIQAVGRRHMSMPACQTWHLCWNLHEQQQDEAGAAQPMCLWWAATGTLARRGRGHVRRVSSRFWPGARDKKEAQREEKVRRRRRSWLRWEGHRR